MKHSLFFLRLILFEEEKKQGLGDPGITSMYIGFFGEKKDEKDE